MVAPSNSVLVGLALTSHDDGALGKATFDNVTISARTLPAGWSTGDIGSARHGGFSDGECGDVHGQGGRSGCLGDG